MRCLVKERILVRSVGMALGTAVSLVLVAPSSGTVWRLAIPTDNAYAKECGACHMAFSPELLPARSWRAVMSSLGNHFGESAQMDASTQQRITEYLSTHAADDANNEQSKEIMRSLGPGNAPLRITQVPYVAALHAAVLDPVWGGNPRPKTLAECSVCHYDAQAGNYTDRRFSVTDEAFRR